MGRTYDTHFPSNSSVSVVTETWKYPNETISNSMVIVSDYTEYGQ
jgi:hypothetical protein